MRIIVSGAAAAALVVALAPAFAQPAPPAPPGVAQGTVPVPVAPPARDMRVRVITDRTMTRDEAVRHIRDMFARLDTNRDGYVTREELDAVHGRMMGMRAKAGKALAARGPMHRPDRGATFDRMDSDHDGSISRQEFMASRPGLREKRVLVMREGAASGGHGMGHMRMMPMHGAGTHFGGRLFDMADANHDGRVSLAEAQAAALAHFDRADLNHDGRITPDERQQMRVMRIERRTS